MSDARLPSEALDTGEGLQPQAMRADAVAASAPPADDLQPMLDLRFPEPPSAATEAAPVESEPVPPESLGSPIGDREASAFTATSQPSQFEAQAPPPTMEAVMEVSPIFSALDAAERTSSLGYDGPAPLQAEPPILVPNSPRFDVRLHHVNDGEQNTDGASENPASPPVEADPAPAMENVETQAMPDEQPDPTEQLHGAAIKIAEEASATAEALESLKRLLNHKLPLLETAVAEPAQAAIDEVQPESPPPLPTYQAPIRPPPMVELDPVPELAHFAGSDAAPIQRGFAVGSFLAGFAFSWVIGAALYAYLTMA